jgi:hypothetical protein
VGRRTIPGQGRCQAQAGNRRAGFPGGDGRLQRPGEVVLVRGLRLLLVVLAGCPEEVGLAFPVRRLFAGTRQGHPGLVGGIDRQVGEQRLQGRFRHRLVPGGNPCRVRRPGRGLLGLAEEQVQFLLEVRHGRIGQGGHLLLFGEAPLFGRVGQGRSQRLVIGKEQGLLDLLHRGCGPGLLLARLAGFGKEAVQPAFDVLQARLPGHILEAEGVHEVGLVDLAEGRRRLIGRGRGQGVRVLLPGRCRRAGKGVPGPGRLGKEVVQGALEIEILGREGRLQVEIGLLRR